MNRRFDLTWGPSATTLLRHGARLLATAARRDELPMTVATEGEAGYPVGLPGDK